MKKAIAILLMLGLIMPFIAGFAALADEKTELNVAIKQLHSEPDLLTKTIFEIPISVTLLDISPDGNWYKVRISYAVGPFNYIYVGWANIPVGKSLK
ncbi:hypothetical protein HZB07_02720 [Candidatus Saganbacteria bacterium]|nr:hypothetical protein [Candidatus Saganbacteria bacterium]